MIGYVTIPEACARLGISRARIYKLIQQNRLTVIQIAGRRRGYVSRVLTDELLDREVAQRITS